MTTTAANTSAVIPVLVTGIQPTASTGARRRMDPGHKARDDKQMHA
jgi:hypothetical protein